MNISLRRYWNLLGRHIRSQKRWFIYLTVLLLGSIGLQVVNPQFVRIFIDAATSGETDEALLATALTFIGLAFLQQVVTVGATYVGENVAWSATNGLRGELVRHCLSLDMSYHNDTKPGELIERIDGDVGELSRFFSQIVVLVIGNLLLLLGVLVALFLEDWRAGAAFSFFAAVALLALNRVRDIAVPHQKAHRQANADLFGFLEEQLAGTEDIRSSGAIDYVMRGLYRLQYAIMQRDREASLMNRLIGVTVSVVTMLGTVAAVVTGYYLHRGGMITLGTVYLIVQYIGLLRRPIHDLARHTESLQTVGASVERLTDLLEIRSKIQDGAGIHLPDGPLSLSFHDVSFAYELEPVLEGLSFRLEPGTVLGLLGRTGSGKTTLARLVMRFCDPTAGQIMLNSVDIRSAQLGPLRQRVAFVTQDVQLFQANVRDNLTFYDRDISDEGIRKVVEELALVDWYQSLPNGLDTQLEPGGHSLSAGEAQLLAFIRVFLRDPGLVILDEASSRLDPVTEHRIERAVDKLLENRTAVIIAHRLETVHRADDIVILEAGRISERGERRQLMEDTTSRFHSLLQTGLGEVLA